MYQCRFVQVNSDLHALAKTYNCLQLNVNSVQLNVNRTLMLNFPNISDHCVDLAGSRCSGTDDPVTAAAHAFRWAGSSSCPTRKPSPTSGNIVKRSQRALAGLRISQGHFCKTFSQSVNDNVNEELKYRQGVIASSCLCVKQPLASPQKCGISKSIEFACLQRYCWSRLTKTFLRIDSSRGGFTRVSRLTCGSPT